MRPPAIVRLVALAALACASLAASCSEDLLSSRPEYLVKWAGDLQVVAPGTAVPVNPRVRVEADGSRPVPGVNVTFSVLSGGGTVSDTVVPTDADGYAEVAWTLGPARGLNVLEASAPSLPTKTFTALAGTSSPNILVQLPSPAQWALIADSAMIHAIVQSTFAVASVTASVAGRSVTLAPAPNLSVDGWGGPFDFRGLPRDSLLFVVTVADVNGDTTDAFAPIIHDGRPVVTLTSPLHNEVVGATISFSASCADDNPAGCDSIVVLFGTSGRLKGTSTLSGSVPIALGDKGSYRAIGYDSRGQQGYVDVNVYALAGPRLSQVATIPNGAPGLLLDAAGSRVLWVDTSQARTTFHITSPSTDSTLVVDSIVMWPYHWNTTPVLGDLLPRGALVNAQFVAASAVPFQWADGQKAWRPGGLARGNYLFYQVGNDFRRLDVTSGANVFLGSVFWAETDFLAPRVSGSVNGSGAWTRYRSLMLYRNGTLDTIHIGHDSLFSTAARTDGVNVAMALGNGGYSALNPPVYLGLWDGSSVSLIAGPFPDQLVPGRDYELNGGWTAFVRRDANGVRQVWTRSPAGVIVQAANMGTNASIEAVADDGRVVFVTSGAVGRRYLATPPYSGAPLNVSSVWGRTVWRDGAFRVLIGRSAFAIVP